VSRLFRFGTKCSSSVECARRNTPPEIICDSCWILLVRLSMAIRNTVFRGDSGQARTTWRRYRRNASSSFILMIYARGVPGWANLEAWPHFSLVSSSLPGWPVKVHHLEHSAGRQKRPTVRRIF